MNTMQPYHYYFFVAMCCLLCAPAAYLLFGSLLGAGGFLLPGVTFLVMGIMVRKDVLMR